MTDDPLRSMKEVAAACGVSRATIYREMEEGKLTFIVIRRRRLVAQSELERYFTERTRTRAA
jgi:excisionase family DNA binding protein